MSPANSANQHGYVNPYASAAMYICHVYQDLCDVELFALLMSSFVATGHSSDQIPPLMFMGRRLGNRNRAPKGTWRPCNGSADEPIVSTERLEKPRVRISTTNSGEFRHRKPLCGLETIKCCLFALYPSYPFLRVEFSCPAIELTPPNVSTL